MGIIKGGPNGEVTGRIGNTVYYILNGQNIVRKIGVHVDNPSPAQLRNRLITRLTSLCLNKFMAMINVGFNIEYLNTNIQPFNLAVKLNKSKIVKGTYPDFQIDYSKIVLSQGILDPGADLQVVVLENVMTFSWTGDPNMTWESSTDQVMMIAYFPEEERTIVKIDGNKRNEWSDQLIIPPSLVGKYAETYIAFVAADRKQVSDSTYLGSINGANL
ncbi:MAG: hypothetical protein EOO92_09780 [Pedobacter sp.]|nr:MAG: hypothetical protein EOO92_09780 [Pedobacter sp.]